MLATVLVLSGLLVNAAGFVGHEVKRGFVHFGHGVKVVAHDTAKVAKALNPEKLLKIRAK